MDVVYNHYDPDAERAAAVADCLMAMRGPAESYSDVILRLVELDAGQRA